MPGKLGVTALPVLGGEMGFMHDFYLTKSDFKIAQTCPTKLYYLKKGYPTLDERDEYLELLADQGYLIEALARTLYPDGRWVGFREDVESAAWETMSAMTENCTLFEATFISNGKMARVDILVRRGNVFELIEIKSRGFDRQINDDLIRSGKPNLFRATKAPFPIRTEWRPYLEDAAFQTDILQEVFPEACVIPYLLLPDTSRPVAFDGLHHRFTLQSIQERGHSAIPHASEYTDDPRDIRRNPLLARVNVSDEVKLLLPDVRRKGDEYLKSLIPILRRVVTPPTTNCRTCEFRVTEGELRGFHECWGELADVVPHILDLYRVGDVGGRKQPLADEMIAQGKVSLFDIPERRLVRKDGTIGKYSKRQRVQIRHTRANREWISDDLGRLLDSIPSPLHFVDFETCTLAVPRYRGMRPFEIISYQWSCHTLVSHDDKPQHSEWLQMVDTFPNSTFAAALRRQLGDTGSILVWAPHETAVLRAIKRQLKEREDGDYELSRWIGDVLESGRIIDMHALALNHYFHPRMGGSTSLKVVSDAIWQANPAIRARLPEYQTDTGDGLTSPYKALNPLIIEGREISVAEGAGAIIAYYAMMDRLAANAALELNQWRALLRQYCKLDTAALMMVWWHWRELTR